MGHEDLSKLKIEKSQTAVLPGRRRNWLYWVAGIFFCLGMGLILYTQGIFTPAIRVETAVVTEAYPSQILTVLNASGYIVPQRKAAVASKVTGRLISLSVEEGSPVKKGQIIARLENEDVVAVKRQAESNLNVAHSNLEQARAELNDATLSFERQKRLLSLGVVAKATYDQAEARYRRAEAAVVGAEAAIQAGVAGLRGAEVAIEYTQIRAPFDAVVLTKNADVGDIITPVGAALNARASVVTIADLDSLQVEADVSESNLERIKIGQSCEIQLDALPGSRFPGVVHMIVPTADRSKATVMVKVRFLKKDPRILPEMNAKVAFLSRSLKVEEEKPRIAVNPSSVVTRNGKTVVFIMRGDRVEQRSVTSGERLGDRVEVLSGLIAGERVVLNPPDRLRDGWKIKTAEK